RRAARASTWNCELNERTNPGDIQASSSELATRTAWALAKRDEVPPLSVGEADKGRRHETNAPITAASMRKGKGTRYVPRRCARAGRTSRRYRATYKQRGRPLRLPARAAHTCRHTVVFRPSLRPTAFSLHRIWQST